jgi:hypothetical protein
MKIRHPKMIGRIQLGRRTIDSNVDPGLKIAPKIRPIELISAGASGAGTLTGVDMGELLRFAMSRRRF